jgi:hypothetical protein
MKKVVFLFSFFAFYAVSVYSQNNPTTAGSNNRNVEEILLSNKTDIALIAEKKVEVEILQNVKGVSKGFKFVPILPFLPKYMPGVINFNAREIKAEQNALSGSGGDILLNKKVERTYTGILLIFWFEEIEITGIAAKIKK